LIYGNLGTACAVFTGTSRGNFVEIFSLDSVLFVPPDYRPALACVDADHSSPFALLTNFVARAVNSESMSPFDGDRSVNAREIEFELPESDRAGSSGTPRPIAGMTRAGGTSAGGGMESIRSMAATLIERPGGFFKSASNAILL
jgi:hypothetical protein